MAAPATFSFINDENGYARELTETDDGVQMVRYGIINAIDPASVLDAVGLPELGDRPLPDRYPLLRLRARKFSYEGGGDFDGDGLGGITKVRLEWSDSFSAGGSGPPPANPSTFNWHEFKQGVTSVLAKLTIDDRVINNGDGVQIGGGTVELLYHQYFGPGDALNYQPFVNAMRPHSRNSDAVKFPRYQQFPDRSSTFNPGNLLYRGFQDGRTGNAIELVHTFEVAFESPLPGFSPHSVQWARTDPLGTVTAIEAGEVYPARAFRGLFGLT